MHVMVVISEEREWEVVVEIALNRWRAIPNISNEIDGGHIIILEDGFWAGDRVLILKSMYEQSLAYMEEELRLALVQDEWDFEENDQYPFFFEIV